MAARQNLPDPASPSMSAAQAQAQFARSGNAMLPPLPPAASAVSPPQYFVGTLDTTKLTPLDRALGATNGPNAGNVRAILAVVLTLGFLALFAFLAVEYLAFGHVQAESLVEQGWGAILTAFGLIVGLYFGTRNQQTGG